MTAIALHSLVVWYLYFKFYSIKTSWVAFKTYIFVMWYNIIVMIYFLGDYEEELLMTYKWLYLYILLSIIYLIILFCTYCVTYNLAMFKRYTYDRSFRIFEFLSWWIKKT